MIHYPRSLSIASNDVEFGSSDGDSSAAEREDRWMIDIASVSDTAILADESSLYWPQHVVHRRAEFQMLLNRYYDQLLYGCSQPDCATPSCLSYQKRKAKGPFRPYTVLTARALATYLASQDHPERGFCTHPSAKDAETGASNSCTSSESRDLTGRQKSPNKVSTSDGQESKDGMVGGVSEEERDPRVTTVKPAVREKDHKSFAQNLFDTTTMRQLTKAEPSSTMYPKSEQSTQTTAGSASLPSNTNGTFKNTNSASKHQTSPEPQVPPQGPAEDQSIILQRQHQAWISMRSWNFRDMFAEASEDPQTVQFVTSSADHVLAYFSFSNSLGLYLGACSTEGTEDRIDLHRLREAFNRPSVPSNPSQVYPGCNPKFTRYIWFIRRSINHICNTPSALIRSFVEWHEDNGSFKTVRSYPLQSIACIFLRFRACDDSNVLFSNSWTSLDYIDTSRLDLATLNEKLEGFANGGPRGSRRRSHFPRANQILSDSEAAHFAKIVLAALTSHVGYLSDDTLGAAAQLRRKGQEAPPNTQPRKHQISYDNELDVLDQFENGAAVSLATRLAKVIGCRWWTDETVRQERLHPDQQIGKGACEPDFMTLLVRNIADHEGLQMHVDTDAPSPSLQGGINYHSDDRRVFAGQDNCPRWKLTVVEWMRTVIIKEWDGKPEVPKRSAIGGALEFLKHMYICCSPEEVPVEIYHTPYLADRLEVLDFPLRWANGTTSPEMVHLLAYPFLFTPAKLVTYFRAINHRAMTKAFQTAYINGEMLRKMTFEDVRGGDGRGAIRLFDTLHSSLAKYLILDIRRDHILEDAMDRLWRREPAELMKPLKVRMGMSTGEEGVDLGGVSQEFFRLAIAEALNPKYGAFTTDPATQMIWFQPGSLEPLHTFETVGLLTSLAIYNGLTLPFTFPKALYKAIAGLPCESIADISDGWPVLARGLQALLDWPDDNVEEVFMRPYTFSTDIFGAAVDINMDHSTNPPARNPELTSSSPLRPPSSSPKMVTNANRHAFVRDYIIHLTIHSVHPQLSAFLAGFRRCLPPPIHDLFTEASLKELIEGQSHIDTHALEAVTKYEPGYHAEHPTIRQFWQVVHEWGSNTNANNGSNIDEHSRSENQNNGQDLVRKLLEFVTASDRLPVGGVERLQFVIQRNGEGDERLPSSMTCFGRLLLPEFSGVEALRVRLERAVREGMGFGLQ